MALIWLIGYTCYYYSDLQVRIREIPVRDKLEYFHCLLSSVLPVIKQIHNEQCSEVELERKLRGTCLASLCCNFEFMFYA